MDGASKNFFPPQRRGWNHKLKSEDSVFFKFTEAADPKPVHKPASRVRGTAATTPLDTPATGE